MKLGVNIDHIATVRQARGGAEPDPARAALICEKAGAHSIVMHLREDRRHIQDRDLFRVRERIGIRLNMEMSIAPSVLSVAKKLKPHQVTLVPEKRKEKTTESGLNLHADTKRLVRAIGFLKEKGIDVSLFIDPDPWQIERALRLKTDAVEFHTGTYAHQTAAVGIKKQLERLYRAVNQASEAGLLAHAGHGLDYQNVKAVRKLRGLDELNIGYSIVGRALWVGLEKAVKEMLALVR